MIDFFFFLKSEGLFKRGYLLHVDTPKSSFTPMTKLFPCLSFFSSLPLIVFVNLSFCDGITSAKLMFSFYDYLTFSLTSGSYHWVLFCYWPFHVHLFFSAPTPVRVSDDQ